MKQSNPLLQLDCQFSLRPYQRRAIEVVLRDLKEGSKESENSGQRWHFVAPPGSGKTILGLELIRLLGEPAVIFSPNAAIQRQWVDKVRHFLPKDASLGVADVVGERYIEPVPPMLSLTYQSITVATRETELLDELARALWAEEVGDKERLVVLRKANPKAYREELLRFRKRVRRRLLDDPEFDATELLHPAAQALMTGLIARGTRTVVLDECHHLTGTWAILLGALIDRLSNPLVIGLTATPPLDRSDKEQVRYLDIVGEIDLQIPTPAVVRDGNLAPYQDLVHFVMPTPHEMDFVASQHEHWNNLERQLNTDGRFEQWIRQRINKPSYASGKRMTWEEFYQRRRRIAVAGGRWFLAHQWELLPEVELTREMLEPLALDDRLRLIADFALRYLKLSQDAADLELYEQLRVAGRALGYNLTERGFRRTVAPVDRLLSLSRSKQEGALTILRHEWRAMREQLRAVIITDFERSSATILHQLSGVLDPDAESALGMMRLLAKSDLEDKLCPVLVTGQTLLCDDTVVELFMQQAQAWFAEHKLDIKIRHEAVEESGFHRIIGTGSDWRTGAYVGMVTSLLEQGITRCVVGTRALLGEGWDSLALNTFIDLTYATTFASVNQLRGRAIRKDPTWANKVANNWDVVCIAPGYDKGMRDYQRFVRKHERFFGVSDDGSIEVGVGHVHPLLHQLEGVESEWRSGQTPTRHDTSKTDKQLYDHLPLSPPQRLADSLTGVELKGIYQQINEQMLAQAAKRERIRQLWQVGTPYDNIEISALDMQYPESANTISRVGRTRQEEALQEARQLAALGIATTLALGLTPIIALFAGGMMQLALETWLLGSIQLGALQLGIGLTWFVLSLTLLVRPTLLHLRKIGQSFWAADGESTVRAMAIATLEALQATNEVDKSLTPSEIRISKRDHGFIRVWLESSDGENIEQFSRAISELLDPVTQEYRYMIPRYEVILPDKPLQRLWHWLEWATEESNSQIAAWHPIPHDLATNAERVRTFEEAWQRHVSPGEAIYLQRSDALEQFREARELPPKVKQRQKRIWR